VGLCPLEREKKKEKKSGHAFLFSDAIWIMFKLSMVYRWEVFEGIAWIDQIPIIAKELCFAVVSFV
jgi:hypothetical protein